MQRATPGVRYTFWQSTLLAFGETLVKLTFRNKAIMTGRLTKLGPDRGMIGTDGHADPFEYADLLSCEQAVK